MRNYILLIIAVVLLGFNIYNLDFQNLLSEDGKVAIIGVLGCLVAIVLLLILISSSKIKNKLEK
jgi:FtsH-binding integral membrane protein